MQDQPHFIFKVQHHHHVLKDDTKMAKKLLTCFIDLLGQSTDHSHNDSSEEKICCHSSQCVASCLVVHIFCFCFLFSLSRNCCTLADRVNSSKIVKGVCNPSFSIMIITEIVYSITYYW